MEGALRYGKKIGYKDDDGEIEGFAEKLISYKEEYQNKRNEISLINLFVFDDENKDFVEKYDVGAFISYYLKQPDDYVEDAYLKRHLFEKKKKKMNK